MSARLIAVITGIALLVISLFGLLVALTAFAGHPPEWILDAYYSISPPSAVGGVILLFAVIGFLSIGLFCLALWQILRHRVMPDGTAGSRAAQISPNPEDRR